MRKQLLATTCAITSLTALVLAGAAVAQTVDGQQDIAPTPMEDAPSAVDTLEEMAPAAGAESPDMPAAPGAAISTDALIQLFDVTVNDSAGEEIGEVNDFLISDTGPTTLIIEAGGFLGMGERLVAVPFSDVTVANDLSLVQLNTLTVEEVGEMPAFDVETAQGSLVNMLDEAASETPAATE